MSEVKEFSTFFAIDRRVAASSQDQTFNVLLLLFKHVLENELGHIEDLVRALYSPARSSESGDQAGQ